MTHRLAAAYRNAALALIELANEVEGSQQLPPPGRSLAQMDASGSNEGVPGKRPRSQRPERAKYIVPAAEVSALDRKRAARVLRERGYVIREDKG